MCLIGTVKPMKCKAYIFSHPEIIANLGLKCYFKGMDVVIFGTGGLGRELKLLADRIDGMNLIGWYDDGKDAGESILGKPVLGNFNDLLNSSSETNVLIGIGNSQIKKKLILQLIENKNISYPNLIHPSVEIDNDCVKLGKGVYLQKGCTLTDNIQIHDFNYFAFNCTIGHDCTIEKYGSFMPGVHISGTCSIGEAAYFGVNSSIINNLKLTNDVIIGASACVTKDITSSGTYKGVPAVSS